MLPQTYLELDSRGTWPAAWEVGEACEALSAASARLAALGLSV
jgi:hypothetical protein